MERRDGGGFVLGVLSALGLVWLGQNVLALLFGLLLLGAATLGIVYLFAFLALKWVAIAFALYVLFVLVMRGLNARSR
ncbi:MAG: hypothetical protein K1X94_18020 [Sandaracinaceae bacterium]|nr:hypothetical protein [Sandaracinaceae bacterium]